jgi:hypothetical protein
MEFDGIAAKPDGEEFRPLDLWNQASFVIKYFDTVSKYLITKLVKLLPMGRSFG